MISRLKGIIIEKNPPIIVIEVNGVGYDVEVSMQTFYQLADLNNAVELFIQAHYREDNQQLFGFSQRQEKEVFKKLIKVNGIGVKTALGILSVLNVSELMQTIEHKNIERLSSVPGIGKKTAERLILELKDKFKLETNEILINDEQHNNDVFETLLALGYHPKEAQNALKNIPSELNISDAVKWALKNLTK